MMLLCIFPVLLSQICHVSAVIKTSGVTEDSGIITAEAGESVTLRCSCLEDDVTFLFWYQQSLGGTPLIIASWLLQTKVSISSPYKERFKVLKQGPNCSNRLEIENVSLSDSATYYCAISKAYTIEFAQGVFLHVKTSSIHTDIHQPPLETLQSGDSVNLSCTVYTTPCVEKQSLYWFRHGASQPAVMYSSAAHCNEATHTKKCVSTLTLKSVSSPDVGMYYCALASCGEITFGNGTKVAIAGGSAKVSPRLVYCLSAALAVSIILLLLLAFIMYKMKKKSCSVCKGPVSHLACSAASGAVSQDADILHYAALSLSRTSKRHRQEHNAESYCVYSSVMSSNE